MAWAFGRAQEISRKTRRMMSPAAGRVTQKKRIKSGLKNEFKNQGKKGKQRPKDDT